MFLLAEMAVGKLKLMGGSRCRWRPRLSPPDKTKTSFPIPEVHTLTLGATENGFPSSNCLPCLGIRGGVAISPHTELPTMGFGILHASQTLCIDAIVAALKFLRSELGHLELEAKSFVGETMGLNVSGKELVVSLNHARILACKTGGAG